jgi:hypothetical protein
MKGICAPLANPTPDKMAACALLEQGITGVAVNTSLPPKQNRWLYLLVAVIAFFAASSRDLYALMPDRHINQYGHRSWRIEDGYLGAMPFSIAQDRDSYLWLGTYYGVYRFDGVRFVRWIPPAGMHLPSLRVTSLLADRDGSLWMGTSGGLAHWHGGRLDNYLEVKDGSGDSNKIPKEQYGSQCLPSAATSRGCYARSGMRQSLVTGARMV